jgi:hypothetical protein
MRHIYVGDVGDFGKYGLLRALCGSAYSLGIVWYLTEAAEHNNDGKHDGYLKLESSAKRSQFRDCDPHLYDVLKQIREQKRLDLSLIEASSIFESTCKFFATPVPHFEGAYPGKDAAQRRWEDRQRWHLNAMAAMKDASIVFVDPDNGIIFDTPSAGSRPSHKHAYMDELRGYINRGQTAVAYHHLGRQKGGHEALIQTCLRKCSVNGLDPWVIHYNRGTGRAFFVFPNQEHRDQLYNASQNFVRTWSRHSRLIDLSSSATGLGGRTHDL